MEAPIRCDFMGKTIYELDFSGIREIAEIKKRITAYQTFIASHPKRSLLILTNLSGCAVNKHTVEYFKQFTLHNKPYIIASATYGLTGFAKVFVNAVNTFSKRDIRHFETPERAKQWLVSVS